MKRITILLLLLASLASTGAEALNLRWLNYSPVRYYNDEDWSIYSATVQEALNAEPDGKSREWKNPKTGANGKVTPLKTYNTPKRTCRKVSLFNSIRGLTGQSVYFFCKPASGEGEWVLTEPNKKKPDTP